MLINKLSVTGSEYVSYLELMWLQFAVSCFGSECRHVGADGCQSFGVGVKHYGRDETVGCAHCYAQVHHMIPGKIQTSQYWRQHKHLVNVISNRHNSAAPLLETYLTKCSQYYSNPTIVQVSVLWPGVICKLKISRSTNQENIFLCTVYWNQTTFTCLDMAVHVCLLTGEWPCPSRRSCTQEPWGRPERWLWWWSHSH